MFQKFILLEGDAGQIERIFNMSPDFCNNFTKFKHNNKFLLSSKRKRLQIETELVNSRVNLCAAKNLSIQQTFYDWAKLLSWSEYYNQNFLTSSLFVSYGIKPSGDGETYCSKIKIINGHYKFQVLSIYKKDTELLIAVCDRHISKDRKFLLFGKEKLYISQRLFNDVVESTLQQDAQNCITSFLQQSISTKNVCSINIESWNFLMTNKDIFGELKDKISLCVEPNLNANSKAQHRFQNLCQLHSWSIGIQNVALIDKELLTDFLNNVCSVVSLRKWMFGWNMKDTCFVLISLKLQQLNYLDAEKLQQFLKYIIMTALIVRGGGEGITERGRKVLSFLNNIQLFKCYKRIILQHFSKNEQSPISYIDLHNFASVANNKYEGCNQNEARYRDIMTWCVTDINQVSNSRHHVVGNMNGFSEHKYNI